MCIQQQQQQPERDGVKCAQQPGTRLASGFFCLDVVLMCKIIPSFVRSDPPMIRVTHSVQAYYHPKSLRRRPIRKAEANTMLPSCQNIDAIGHAFMCT